jgi:hypothetical protein
MRIKPGFLTLIIFALLVSICSFIVKAQRQKRQAFLSSLIYSLEKYKVSNGTYPSNISKMDAADEDWLYYSPDSAGRSFILAYNAGIMNANTFRYSSKTKSWEKIFNY